MSKYLLFFSCVTLFLVASCEKEYVTKQDAGTSTKTSSTDDSTDDDTTQNNSTDTTENLQATVSFSEDIVPILTSNCVRCHDASTSFNCEESAAYSTIVDGGFVNTSDPENSTFFTEPNEGHADSYLVTADHNKIVTWIKEGAKDN